jgi:disease resistance protein RPM1
MFLYLSRYTRTYLPAGYRNLTSLLELSGAGLTDICDPEEPRYLTELRVLFFWLPAGYPHLRILFESIDKLHKLESLNIESSGVRSDNLGDWVPSSLQLRSLYLGGWYETLPKRINSSSLPLLSYLHINVHQVQLDDIQVLGTLPALRTLRLHSDMETTEEEHAKERSFMLSTDAFPCAITCMIPMALFAPYMFPRGAMPAVQELSFGLLVSDILSGGDWDLCLRNLPSLKTVHVNLHGEDTRRMCFPDVPPPPAGPAATRAAAAVMTAAAAHPNYPRAYAE